MKTCIHCQKIIDDRSKFCPHCGQTQEIVVDQDSNDQPKTPEVVANHLGSMALVLFFVALLGFDFLLPTLFDYLKLDPIIPFYISSIIYLAACLICILSLVDYFRKKRQGIRLNAKANSTAYAVMVMSIFLLVMNVTQVIMK